MISTTKLVICFIALVGSIPATAAKVDYKEKIKSSDIASSMFGPVPPNEAKKIALNIGRIGISFKSTLNCGEIDVVGSIGAEFDHVEEQLTEGLKQVQKFVTNPTKLALGIICYYKPNVCSYIRHLSARLQESLNLQFDACQAMDKYINDQANKGLKLRQAEAVESCMEGKDVTGENIRNCNKNSTARARNLLYPFQKRYSTASQKALNSMLKAVKKSDNYEIWSKLLGEVEIKKNGWWVKSFPNDLLRPDEFADNMVSLGKNYACDFNKIKQAIEDTSPLSSFTGIDFYIRKVIKTKITGNVVRDLKSLPDVDGQRACNSLGESIAEAAVKRSIADGKSTMSAALSNGALPDDLRIFYQNKTSINFDSVHEAINAKKVIPLRTNIRQLEELALKYRKLNRKGASTMAAKKIFNEESKTKRKCEDEFSCEQ